MPILNGDNTRSNEVDEILSRTPSWLLRYGIMVFGFILFLAAILSFIIEYSDTIQAEVTIFSEYPPAHLRANTTAPIRNLFIKNHQLVNKGDVLLELENSANFNSILMFKNELYTLKQFIKEFSPALFASVKNNKGFLLGDLQNSYSAISLLIDDYISYKTIEPYEKEISLLRNNLSNYRLLHSKNIEQINLKLEEYHIVQNKIERDSLLFSKLLISEEEYEQTKKQLLKIQFEINSLKTNNMQVQIQIADILKEIAVLNNLQKEKENGLRSEIIAAYENLVSDYKEWELKFLLISPINGEVSLADYWSENLNVKMGDIVVSILPKKNSNVQGLVRIPLKGVGKIKKGHKVNIQLENYPYQEFGLLSGKISSINTVPTNNYYSAYIELHDSLKTNYNVTIPFSHEMRGVAEIIIERRLLINRIIEPIKYLIT